MAASSCANDLTHQFNKPVMAMELDKERPAKDEKLLSLSIPVAAPEITVWQAKMAARPLTTVPISSSRTESHRSADLLL